MKTIGIVAEFNPFHNGHLHLIDECKKSLGADRCIVIMSGDYVQRGAPAIIDKFSRTKMALLCGADVVLELPIYYSLGSAEYFAGGAVSILDSIGCVDYLCFGSENGDIETLTKIARLLNNENEQFNTALTSALRNGQSFAKARQSAVLGLLSNDEDIKDLESILSSPNNILAIEYIRALINRHSKIIPYTIERIGESYNSTNLGYIPSATAIRNVMLNRSSSAFYESEITENSSSLISTRTSLQDAMPNSCEELILSYDGIYATTNAFSDLLFYKLIMEKDHGFESYLDVSRELSDKIISNLDDFTSFDDFCMKLKSKEITYSRISRALMHILLDINVENMQAFKDDNYTGYARILGAKKDSSDAMKAIRTSSSIPVIGNLKEANSQLSGLTQMLFNASICSSAVYNKLFRNQHVNEYRKPFLLI